MRSTDERDWPHSVRAISQNDLEPLGRSVFVDIQTSMVFTTIIELGRPRVKSAAFAQQAQIAIVFVRLDTIFVRLFSLRPPRGQSQWND